MEVKKYRLPRAEALSLPRANVETLLSLRSGECALLYLQVLAAGGELDVPAAARALARGEEEIRAAAEALGQAGLLSAETPLPPPEALPEYRAEDVARRGRSDPAFQALVAEAQRVMGHALSGADLKTLFGIYDRLGMPGEVILLMINHVAAVLRRRYGEGRLPTMHAVEKEAFRWANLEIYTLEQAEEYVDRFERQAEEGEKIRRALGLTDRPLTPTERKYLERWVDMGYGAETLALAYDRTVVSTGKLAWAYMDRIVQSWYEKGLFTPGDVEKGDKRPAGKKRTAPAPAAGGPRGDDLDRLEKMLHIKE